MEWWWVGKRGEAMKKTRQARIKGEWKLQGGSGKKVQADREIKGH